MSSEKKSGDASLISTPREIRANSFVLEDEQARVRGKFSVENGQPTLRFYDQHDRTRSMILVTNDGIAAIAHFDENGTQRAEMAVTKDGVPVLIMYDRFGKQRLSLGLEDDTSALMLSDKLGARRLNLGAFDETAAGLSICDAKGVARLWVMVDDDLGARMVLKDANGKTVWDASGD